MEIPPRVNLPRSRSTHIFERSTRLRRSDNNGLGPFTTPTTPQSSRPQPRQDGWSASAILYRSPVYQLACKECSLNVCVRAMKVPLIKDTKFIMYSTDAPSQQISLLPHDYFAAGCQCRLRDLACLGCGNVLGYHIITPCNPCLESDRRGHFWMFHSTSCQIIERLRGNKVLTGTYLRKPEEDPEFIAASKLLYEQYCR